MESLGNSESIQLFSYRSIQTIIDYKWPLVKEYTIKKLFFPFAVYLIAFFVYSNYIYENIHRTDNSEAEKVLGYAIMATLLALSVYFIANETRQLISTGFDYLL